MAFPKNILEEAIYSFLFHSYSCTDPEKSLFVRMHQDDLLSIAGLNRHIKHEGIYQKLRDVYNNISFERMEVIIGNLLFPTKDERPYCRWEEESSKVYLISEKNEKNMALEIEDVLKRYNAIEFLGNSKDSELPVCCSSVSGCQDQRMFYFH